MFKTNNRRNRRYSGVFVANFAEIKHNGGHSHDRVEQRENMKNSP